MAAAPSESPQTQTQAQTQPQSFEWHLIKRFLSFLKPQRQKVIIGIALIPISVACSVLYPWLIITIIDEQLVPGELSGLTLWVGLLVLVLALNYVSDALYAFSLNHAALHAILKLRQALFERIINFPRRYFDKTPLGVMLTRLTSDLEAINESFAQGLLNMVRDVLITIALLIFLLTVSFKLTLVVLLIGPPIYLVTQYLRKKLRSAYLESRVVLAQGTGFLQESLNGMKTVQLYNAETQVEQRYQGYTEAFYQQQSKSNLYDAGLFAIIEGITTISMGLIIWYGATEILSASITLGVLVGFINTLDKIFVPIRDFTSQLASIQRALAAFEHIEAVFEQPTINELALQHQANHLPAYQSAKKIDFETALATFESLEFKDVRFRYSENGPLVLDGISFQLQRGKQIALVGSTGSGKSTIFRLLTKTYSGYQGSILINGIELSSIDVKYIARLFSLMQQEVYLFNQSIAFNIALAKPHINREQMMQAAKYVYADAFIEQLPRQYDFELKDNGGNLSAGQGQLISFARAIAGGNEVIMLDEATSSVDSLTEKLIQKAIDHLFDAKTVIAIAHRLSTIVHSDEILVLDQGKIVERGNHRTLIALNGIYANLQHQLKAADSDRQSDAG